MPKFAILLNSVAIVLFSLGVARSETRVSVKDAKTRRPTVAIVVIYSTDDPPNLLFEKATDDDGIVVIPDNSIGVRHKKVVVTATAEDKSDDREIPREPHGWPRSVELFVREDDVMPSPTSVRERQGKPRGENTFTAGGRQSLKCRCSGN